MTTKAITLLHHDVVDEGGYNASGRSGPGSERYKVDKDGFGWHLRAISSAANRRPTLVSELKEVTEILPYLLASDWGGSALRFLAEQAGLLRFAGRWGSQAERGG